MTRWWAHPAIPWVAPFATFMLFLAVGGLFPWGFEILYPVRIAVVTLVILFVSWPVLDWRVSRWFGSVALGVAVFAVWIGPDLLWPTYRSHGLFHNAIVGSVGSSVPESVRANLFFVAVRFFGCMIAVPVLEELFWRGWLARWLLDSHDFRNVPLGQFTTATFWISSVLFAAEHGPYWDVGLAAGVAYNWWMRRTRSLADCILAHAVTNACLSVYVLQADQWQYWL